jgi:hypothetical protein
MNSKQYEVKTLLNSAGATQAAAGTTQDLGSSPSIQRREVKVIVGSQVLTAGTFPLTLTECDTTNGTFSAVDGDSIVSVTATQAAVAVAEYHVKPAKRYIKASIGTVSGTGAAANLLVLMLPLKRHA